MLNSLSILVSSTDETLQLSTDETYTLFIDFGEAVLKAQTVYGYIIFFFLTRRAMKGLETFSQLAQWDFDNAQYEIPVGPVSIIGKF